MLLARFVASVMPEQLAAAARQDSDIGSDGEKVAPGFRGEGGEVLGRRELPEGFAVFAGATTGLDEGGLHVVVIELL